MVWALAMVSAAAAVMVRAQGLAVALVTAPAWALATVVASTIRQSKNNDLKQQSRWVIPRLFSFYNDFLLL